MTLNEVLERSSIEWHGVELNRPDWSEDSRSLVITFRSLRADMLLHGMINAYWEPLTFELPSTLTPSFESKPWRRWIDTALASPEDITPWETARAVTDVFYTVQHRSVVVLVRHTHTDAVTMVA